MNILVNLPETYFTAPALRPIWRRLRSLGSVRFRSHDKPEQIARDLAWAEAVLMWSWPPPTRESLADATKLRFSGHIDLRRHSAEAMFERGIEVSVVKRCWSPAVAELALALVLACLRRTSNHHDAMWRGRETWLGVRDLPTQANHERQLTGRRVGIVGFGAIGRRLAELLAPFKVQLFVHDPFVSPAVLQAADARSVPLLSMMREADIVVIAAAANAGSKYLIGRREITALGKNAVFVNTARAALVDQTALIARLKKGDLYAALDVFDPEPLPKNSPLRRLPNVYMTPHRAGGVIESVQRAAAMLVDELTAFAAGRPRNHALTPEMVASLDD
jgi:phosphoglycerate dehydrogenase-like enzyme